MTPRYPDKTLSGVSALVAALAEDEERIRTEIGGGGDTRIPVWYRGQPNGQAPLIPTIETTGFRLDLEQALLNRFKQNAGPFLRPAPDDRDEWSWMFLMRHYRAPSRLLDWTESALIGLYFAVQESTSDDKDGALWMLLPSVLNEKAKISVAPLDPADLPMFGPEKSPLNNYLITRVAETSGSKVPPAAGIGTRNSERMTAQQGVFTVFHADLTPLEDWHDGQHVWRYLVASAEKPTIRQELRRLGVNRLTIFPELESVAEIARQVLYA